MLDHPAPSLAVHVAALRADLRTEAALSAAQSGLIAALHALILAFLVRILGRLEALVELWQAGQLPPARTSVRATRSTKATNPARPRHDSAQRKPARRRSAPLLPAAPSPCENPSPAGDVPTAPRTCHRTPRLRPPAQRTRTRAPPSRFFCPLGAIADARPKCSVIKTR